MDINIDALYNILKQNQRDVNDEMGSKKKTVVVTSDPLALIAEKTNVSRKVKRKLLILRTLKEVKPMISVKEYQENDKIGTKPDQIKKKREAWQSSEKSRA
nr:hypothetical protein [Tanacetum cinerariifolium]